MITAEYTDFSKPIQEKLDTHKLDMGDLATEVGTVLDTVVVRFSNGHLSINVNGQDVSIPHSSSDWILFVNNENYSHYAKD